MWLLRRSLLTPGLGCITAVVKHNMSTLLRLTIEEIYTFSQLFQCATYILHYMRSNSYLKQNVPVMVPL